MKGAVAVVDSTGLLNVVAVEEEKTVDKVRYGCVKNVGDVANAVNNIRRKLENYPQVSPNKIKAVYVAVGGRSLLSVPREVERHFPVEMEVTSRVIDELKEQAGMTNLTDKDVVAVLPRNYRIDNMQQLEPVGIFGHGIVADFNLITCRPELKNNLNRVFTERLELRVAGYVVRPMAVADLVLTDDERRLGVMLVDFGAETTTVSIYKDGSLQYVATLPIGSRNITRDLTVLNCLEERAEEIKKVVGNAMPQAGAGHSLSTDGLDYTEINNYVQARADEIVSNILEQIKYAGMQDTDLPTGIVIVGGGAKLRGFNDLVAQQSRMKVRQGAIGGGIRIVPPGLQPADIIDIVAVLSDAATKPVVDCMERPVPQNPADGDDYDDADDGRASRIGRYDEDDDDDDVLADDDEDAYSRPVKKKEKTGRHKGSDTDKSSRSWSLAEKWRKARERLAGIVGDDDKFENYNE